MRILHTSDWHLGHSLHGVSRQPEHAQFLQWLLATLQSSSVDVLLISGDVFDVANPTAAAVGMWFDFLAAAKRQQPKLQIVAIAGNHDSGLRLQSPQQLLHHQGVHVLGTLRDAQGRLDPKRLVIPLYDADGSVAAHCAAVPFLRPGDLNLGQQDDLIEGVRQVYQEVLQYAREQLQPKQALLAMGHCFMVGTQLSDLSERKILGGNQHALPADIFADDLCYVALGHLHKAQAVAGRESMRYCGSPLPLSMAEAKYRHQVCLLEVQAGVLQKVETPSVPRSIDMLRLPKNGSLPLAELQPLLAALPEMQPGVPQPFLECCVRLDAPCPDLRQQVEALLQDKAPRLLKLSSEYPGDQKPLAAQSPASQLQNLQPEDVFLQLYKSKHDGEAPAALLAAFHDLLDDLQQSAAPQIATAEGAREGQA